MNKKELQRAKKANKLLISALLLGTLCVPTFADEVTLSPTLDKIYVTSTEIVNNFSEPLDITSIKPLSGQYITINIDGKNYFYKGDLPTGVRQQDMQNLADTGISALTTVKPTETSKAVYSYFDNDRQIEILYYYDTAKLPKSIYNISETTDNHYNFTKTIGNITKKYNLSFITSLHNIHY